MSGSRRIGKELAELTSNPPPGIKVSLFDESDIHKWKIIAEGPKDTPFAGGNFVLALTLPADYPFKPPTLAFQTKIYHPNVANDATGAMCLGLIRADSWKPPTKMVDVLGSAYQMLSEPNIDDAVEQSIAKEYKENREKWRKTAKEWTKKYANP